MKGIFTLLLLIIHCSCALAQELYTVRVGSFRDVKAADFPDLNTYGLVYGSPRGENVTDVYVGNFSKQADAQQVATTLLSGKYRNAQVLPLPTAGGQPVTVIQVAYQAGDRPLNWASLDQAGTLYVESVDGVHKVVTGIYPDGQTALTYLPAIQELGFRDAFIKKVNNVRLIPVGTFETGIKKPLIPFEMQKPPPATTPGAPAPAPAPTTYEGTTLTPTPTTKSPTPPAAANPPTLPADAAAPGLPAIDGRVKRSSAAELQRVLKEKGYYTGTIDGLYGPGTASAYRAAWDDMSEVRKYRLLTGALFAPVDTDRSSVTAWPEVSVLLRIAEDMAAGMANADRARQLAQQREALYTATQPLAPAAASRVRAWAATLWSNIGAWSTEDPLHAQIVSALRVAYYQSQVRLENHFQQQGIGAIESRDLATALLQNLVGAELDRFL